MRDIRFRAWDVKSKYMVESDQLIATIISRHIKEGRGLQNGNGPEPKKEDYILMQYTGLKDKNGKEIYEGDIVKDSAMGETAVIGFSGGNFTYTFTKKAGQVYVDCFDVSTEYCGAWHEVIGNIYENPKLLGNRIEKSEKAKTQ